MRQRRGSAETLVIARTLQALNLSAAAAVPSQTAPTVSDALADSRNVLGIKISGKREGHRERDEDETVEVEDDREGSWGGVVESLGVGEDALFADSTIASSGEQDGSELRAGDTDGTPHTVPPAAATASATISTTGTATVHDTVSPSVGVSKGNALALIVPVLAVPGLRRSLGEECVRALACLCYGHEVSYHTPREGVSVTDSANNYSNFRALI